MLLVVVDQARIRRRGDDGVERPRQLELARVAVEHRDRPVVARTRANAFSRATRVERVAAQEVVGTVDRAGTRACACGTSTARPAAPAGSRGRSVSSAAPNVRRARARRAARRRARSVGERAEAEQVVSGLRREPRADERRRRPGLRPRRARSARARRAARARARTGCTRSVFTRISRQLNAAMSTPALRGPDSSAWTSVVPEPANGSSDGAARRHVAAKELLDELRDVLAQVRVQPVHVLRPLALGQVALRPREIEVQAGVQLLLRRSHGRRVRVEGARNLLDTTSAPASDVEAHSSPRLAMGREPGGRRPSNTLDLHAASPSRADRRTRRPPSTSPRTKASMRPGARPGRAPRRRARRSGRARGSRGGGTTTRRASQTDAAASSSSVR